MPTMVIPHDLCFHSWPLIDPQAIVTECVWFQVGFQRPRQLLCKYKRNRLVASISAWHQRGHKSMTIEYELLSCIDARLR